MFRHTKMHLLSIALSGMMLLLGSCTRVKVNSVKPDGPVDTPSQVNHELLDALLKQYVADGRVDYEGLKASNALKPYLEMLATTDPSAMPEQAQLAFWINAYNALTMNLIADNYPTKSILRLSPVGIKGIPFIVPKVNTPFKVDVGIVGGEVRTLDEIEHQIIRKEFNEPRIHFALVCAAISCPPLRNEAYNGEQLDAQLDDQAIQFLHNTERNRVDNEELDLELSKIFKWFAEDFGDDDKSVQQFIAPYFEGETRTRLLEGAYDVGYMGYNWGLNDQATREAASP